MPQRYKLRLGDGTFLSVDMDGLRSWTHDRAAVAQAVGSQQWRPLKDVLAEEENAARLLRALIPPQPKSATPAPSVTPAPAPAPVTPAPFTPAPVTPLPTARPAAVDVPQFEPPVFGSGTPSFGQPLAFGEPAFGDPPPVSESPAFSEPAFREPPVVRSQPTQNLQVLADETRSASPDINDASLPAIRLKPLEEDRGGFRSAWDDEGAHQEEEEEVPHDQGQGPLLAILAPLGAFLSRTLTSVAPLIERLSSSLSSSLSSRSLRSPRDPASSSPRVSASSSRAAEAEGPSLGEKATAAWSGFAERLAGAWSGFPEKLAGAWSGLAGRFRRSESEASEDEPEAPRPGRAPLPPRGLAPEPASPLAPRRPVAPPEPISQIRVVPLADAVGPREPEDVYEEGESSDFLGPIWFWTQRIVVLGLLVAGGNYLYQERANWFPKAADLGQTVFNEIDKQVLSRQRSEQQQRALVDATARLPQLTPQTILLAFGQSPTGVLEAPDVFQVAREAAERGMSRLPPAEAQELRALESELASALSAPERRRLDEYDQARSRRIIFSFENPYAMDLVAKGARALPMAKLERLRALLQQAVAEGLDVPAPPAASPSPAAATPASKP